MELSLGWTQMPGTLSAFLKERPAELLKRQRIIFRRIINLSVEWPLAR